jgi:membrane associated rhomboid family serine protease
MAKRLEQRLTFGGRVPWAIGLLLVLTVVLSLVTAFGDRHAGSLFDLVAFRPAGVWRGEVWRLLAWPFVEPSPIGLIFTCLFLYWFGCDLAGQWGSRKFLTVFGGVLAVAGLGTCLIAKVDSTVLDHAYLGSWALTTAMIVAWGLWYPDRVVRIYFVLPIRGFWIAWLTVAVTAVFAIYSGWGKYLPELLSEGAILAWLYRRTLSKRWSKASKGFDARRQGRQSDNMRRRGRKVVDYLRAVDTDDKRDPE